MFQVRPWNCPVRNHERRCAHSERILHLVGSHSKIFQVSLEPKRCVERKVLNCLPRIVAYFRPSVGGNLQILAAAGFKALRLLPWKGQTLPLHNTAARRQNVTREIPGLQRISWNCATRDHENRRLRGGLLRNLDAIRRTGGLRLSSRPVRRIASRLAATATAKKRRKQPECAVSGAYGTHERSGIPIAARRD